MKTINVYSITELSQDARDYAIEKYKEKNTEIFWQDETIESLKGLFENCNGIKLKDYSLGEYNSNIDVEFSQDEVENISGKRAFAWIENNLLSNIRIPYKHDKRKEYLKYGEGYKSGQIKSCPFTGYCADENFLDCLMESIKSGMNLKKSFESLASEYQKIINNEIEYQNSDDYIIEHMLANDYQFLNNGQAV